MSDTHIVDGDFLALSRNSTTAANNATAAKVYATSTSPIASAMPGGTSGAKAAEAGRHLDSLIGAIADGLLDTSDAAIASDEAFAHTDTSNASSIANADVSTSYQYPGSSAGQ